VTLEPREHDKTEKRVNENRRHAPRRGAESGITTETSHGFSL